MADNGFTVKYQVTGDERKRLADCIAGFLGCEKEYLGAPGFAYRVGKIEIHRDGTVHFDGSADIEQIRALLEKEGFAAEEDIGLTVRIPLSKVNLENLNRLLEARGALVKKALGIDDLPVEIEEDTVAFPWFSTLPEPEEVKACTHLIASLCEMSRKLKRVTATEKDVENEKFAFRCFLVRLGFVGEEYKGERRILLRNLSGSSAYKSGQKNSRVNTPD